MLEPCSSHGRTPPCTEALLAAGVARVVAACPDPDPRHRGAGLERLAAEGIETEYWPEAFARRALVLNEHFFCWRLSGRPFVTLKAASSLDGRTATASGESRWITGADARASVHHARRAHMAILCGVGTVIADDPALTVRSPGVTGVEPLRIVLDPTLRSPPTIKLLNGEGGPVLFATCEAAASERGDALVAAGAELLTLRYEDSELDLGALLDDLGSSRSISGVLVEGGEVTTGRFLARGLGDAVLIHLAPLVIGGARGQHTAFAGFAAESLADAKRLWDVRVRQVGDDIEVCARLPGGFSPLVVHPEDKRDRTVEFEE